MANSAILSALKDALASSDLVSSGSTTFYKGQDSNASPSQVDDAAYYKGINVTTKHGYLSPRPGYTQQQFTVINDGVYKDDRGGHTTYSRIFTSGKFQGACRYCTEAGERIVCVYSGIIFFLTLETHTAQVIPVKDEISIYSRIENRYEPKTQRLNQYVRRFNFSQAGDKLVIFDYPDRPIILDGYSAYRSPIGTTDVLDNPVYYVPATVMGCYNTNRLFVASATNEFTAGDPTGSLVAPNAPVTFNEVYQEAGEYRGQVFSLGSTNKNNPITAMGFMQSSDVSTGIGPLYIATNNSLYSYRTNIARSEWASADPFGTMVLYNAGIIGSRAVSNLNSDLIFMSGDGHIRSFNASKEYTGTWEHTPIDKEVWNWVNTPLTSLLDMTIVQYYGNKILVSVQPCITKAADLYGNLTYDYAFKGLVVLELDSMSGLNNSSVPAWAGIWTGLSIMEMVQCSGELVIFTKDPAYINQLYTLDLNSTTDFYNNQHKSIKSRIYTKQYAPSSLYVDKKERTLILGLQDLEGDVVLDVYRSNDYSDYSLWKHWEYSAPTCTDTADTLIPHNFRELNFGTPEVTECNPVTGEYGEIYRGTQLLIDIEASNWRLEHVLILSDTISSDYSDTVCSLVSNKEIPATCNIIADLDLYHTSHYVEE